jgi:hypothetical protein
LLWCWVGPRITPTIASNRLQVQIDALSHHFFEFYHSFLQKPCDSTRLTSFGQQWIWICSPALTSTNLHAVGFFSFSWNHIRLSGGWLAKTQIPADKSQTYYVIDAIDDDNRAALKEILEGPMQWPLITNLYRECMDLDAIEQAGPQVMNLTLSEIEKLQPGVISHRHSFAWDCVISDSACLAFLCCLGSEQTSYQDDLMSLVGRLHRHGADAFFSFSNGADLKNPLLDIGQVFQA